MKLTSVSTDLDVALGNFELNLNRFQAAQVHYLVGDNGSGKTRLLELAFACLSRNTASNLISVGQTVESFTESSNGDSTRATVTRNQGAWTNRAFRIDTSGQKVEIPTGEAPVPFVYLPTESNFQVKDIKSATGEVPDASANVALKATNLHQEIPQLLVNLEHLDNADIAYQYKSQDGQVTPDTKVELRIDRFKAAYRFLMGGSKQFKEIRQEAGQHRVIFTDESGQECDLGSLSSGEKQVVFRLGFVLAHLSPSRGGIILIDEPELSLHPTWQTRYIEAIRGMFSTAELQILVATHSPFIFQSFDSTSEECLRIDRTMSTASPIKLTVSGSTVAPSPPLVAYKAFDIWTEALHIELFDHLLSVLGCSTPSAAEKALRSSHGIPSSNRAVSGGATFVGSSFAASETLPVWVRNHLHHPDQNDRKVPSEADKRDSVELMLNLLA